MTRRRNRMRWKIGQANHVGVQPLPVWFFGSYFVLELRIVNDASFTSIDKQHLARLKTSFQDYLFWRNIKYSNFRGHDDKAVPGHTITRRPKSIPIQHRTDANAVTENHRSWTVPGFHQARVVFIEGFLLVAHRFMAIPGFRNEHHHRVRQRTSTHDEHFKSVVDHGRIAAALNYDGKKILSVLAEQY